MTEHEATTAHGSEPGILSKTLIALKVASGRWDTRLIFLATAVGYLLLYLFTVGDLAVGTSSGGLSIRVADDLSRAFASVGFFRFDVIALVSAGPITFLFSPLNVLLATVLASLVGANLALTYLGWIQPSACGLEASTGALAGIPALLSGAACCGPTILIVVGIQASGAIITGFELLVPIAVVMLVGGLLLIGRQVDPARL